MRINLRSRSLWAAVLLLIGAGLWLFLRLGYILHHEDPLAHADVIFPLGGGRLERVVEAADLFAEGWAPRVLLAPEMGDNVVDEALRRRGVRVPSEIDVQQMALSQLGVKPEAIEVFDKPQASTATEAEAIAALAGQRGWRTVIVVTSKMHTARAGLVMRRRLDDNGVRVIMRASRYDTVDLGRWWANRVDLRFAIFEAQKLSAYWVGLAD